MSVYTAGIAWERGEQRFVDNRYSRRHEASFDGGVNVAMSSSPKVVRVPFSDPTAVDPEELFVASLASCHMLWFLSIAAAAGFCVDSYRDAAEGEMAADAAGRMVMATVTLRPHCHFSGEKLPSDEEYLGLHEQAHHECFLANSVRCEMRIEAVNETGPLVK